MRVIVVLVLLVVLAVALALWLPSGRPLQIVFWLDDLAHLLVGSTLLLKAAAIVGGAGRCSWAASFSGGGGSLPATFQLRNAYKSARERGDSGHARAYSDWDALSSVAAGMATTLGVCHAVETRTGPVGSMMVWVIAALTTATTRPSQSSTGAPEAP